MSSTRDWMRGGQDYERPAPTGLTLAGIVAWTLALIVVADFVFVLARLVG